MSTPEETLRVMEEAAGRKHPSGYVVFRASHLLALIAAYREQGRELEKLRTLFAASSAFTLDLSDNAERYRAAAREAASARIDEIAALTEERDQARVERDALQMTAEEQSEVFGERFASLTALLNKATMVVAPFLEWISDELKLADELQPDLISFDDGCEVDPDDLAKAASTRPLKWGDFRKLRALRAEIEAALQPKEPKP